LIGIESEGENAEFQKQTDKQWDGDDDFDQTVAAAGASAPYGSAPKRARQSGVWPCYSG